jgi:actin cytoskeleton-regulatory complex protein PAN1
MFSSSNAFLGGANSARPGQPGFGQQQQSFNQQQPGGGFGGSLGAQPTGYANGQLQQQYTGFPGQPQQFVQPQQQQFGQQPQQLQNQFTSYPSSQQFQQPQLPQQSQSLQTGFGGQNVSSLQAPSQPPAQLQRPQPTGMTSSQMAASFKTGSSAPVPSAPAPSKSSKIPNMRLSFITAQDQAKFEQLFKKAVGNEQALSGDQAKEILLRSNLDGNALSDIW